MSAGTDDRVHRAVRGRTWRAAPWNDPRRLVVRPRAGRASGSYRIGGAGLGPALLGACVTLVAPAVRCRLV